MAGLHIYPVTHFLPREKINILNQEALKLLVPSVLVPAPKSWVRIHMAGHAYFSIVLGDSKYCWTNLWLILKKQDGLG